MRCISTDNENAMLLMELCDYSISPGS